MISTTLNQRKNLVVEVKHSYNPKIAKKYGLEEAIIIENIWFWIHDKTAFTDEKIWYDGKLWLRLTREQMHSYFKYLTVSTIRRKLIHLINENVLETGNFNLIPNRGLWYTFSSKFIPIMQNGQ